MAKSTHRKIPNLIHAYIGRWFTFDTGILWIVAGAGAVLASLLAFLGIYDRPIADDYVWIYQAHSMGIPQFVHSQLWYTYGRYSNALALALLGKVFNTASVMVAPLILILILVGATYYLVTAFGIKKVRAAAIALAATSFFLACVPSIFDSVYWMNSSTLYPMAVAGSMIMAGITLKIWTADKVVAWKLAIALCVAFLAGGFNEFAPVINLIIIALVCFAWTGKQYSLRRYAIGAMVATQLLALAVLKWAPGSLHRQSVAQSGASSTLHTLRLSFHSMGQFITSIDQGHFILIIMASATLALALYNFKTVEKYTIDIWHKAAVTFALSVVLFVLPVFFTVYAHSIRDDGQPPYRVQAYLVAGMILALTTIIWTVCTLLKLRNDILKNILLVVALCFAMVLSISRIGDVGQAITERSFLYDQRTVMANLQLGAGRTTLSLPQVPIYTTTDAVDLPLSNSPDDTYAWVSHALAIYLGAQQVKTDNTKSLRQCPPYQNWYTNYQYCESVYKSAIR